MKATIILTLTTVINKTSMTLQSNPLQEALSIILSKEDRWTMLILIIISLIFIVSLWRLRMRTSTIMGFVIYAAVLFIYTYWFHRAEGHDPSATFAISILYDLAFIIAGGITIILKNGIAGKRPRYDNNDNH